MPTVAESMWLARKERVDEAVRDFVKAARGSVDDSVDVLSARLFGAGLRGQDLKSQVRLAEMEKSEHKGYYGCSLPPGACHCPQSARDHCKHAHWVSVAKIKGNYA
jgi:hypothetical protein